MLIYVYAFDLPFSEHDCPEKLIFIQLVRIIFNTSNKILNKKITHWIFGHIHHNICQTNSQIKFLCHPRGRPEDFNRILYDVFSSKI